MNRKIVDGAATKEITLHEYVPDTGIARLGGGKIMDIARVQPLDAVATRGVDPVADDLDKELEETERVKPRALYVDVNATPICPPSTTQTKSTASGGDVYLNASLQLLHQQSDTRQRIRNLWFLTQRLRWDNHIDAHAVDLLHEDLLNALRSLGVEKQDGDRMRKTGYLLLLDPVARLGGVQRVRCTLCEETSKLEIQLPAVPPTSPVKEAFSLARLSSSLSRLLHEDASERDCIMLPLYGAQVHATSAEDLTFRLEIQYRGTAEVATDAVASRSFHFQAEDEDAYIAWMMAIESVARYDLFQLQAAIRRISEPEDYVSVLSSFCPITVPLAWQRHRIAKEEKASGLQRRDSKNMPMLQVIKDIERDSYVVDGVPMATAGGVNDVIAHLVARAVAHLQAAAPDDVASAVTSPAARMSKSTEAKALGFVERVLRGSARTQSGGDIYDAISILCANKHLIVCPISHDATPVRIDVVDDGSLQVHVAVSMQFRVMAHEPTSHSADWGRLQGTLRRTFTYGAVTQPGTVEVALLT
ncbi:hypothetical protein ACHHYP_01720 [Achlya hypogyna]|uniref:PH domain-containing protein n=1 Tax=Achlya hypogyna TaxID=1202772 RepID=A0A1V9ZT66_ACHHY|nr:hypothetical protein ACHHYP_01720 [Achlya hypogyna]